MKLIYGLLLLLALAADAEAQQTFLLWSSANSGAATMESAGARAFGVVGQTAIGEIAGSGFRIRAGFAVDTVITDAIVGTVDGASLPTAYVLEQNFPNPFNPSTTIRYALSKGQHVELKIYNILGDEVATLVDAAEEAGVHAVTWQAGAYASGVYLCRLRTEAFTATRKLVLLR